MEKNVFDLNYWRDKHSALTAEVGEYRRSDLVEFNPLFATAKGKDGWFRVKHGKGGLVITRDVCVALERHLSKKNTSSNVEKSIMKTQKLVLQ